MSSRSADADGAGPLGRYALSGDDSCDLREVHLIRTPLELLVSAREHHDGLMREFRLLALAGRTSTREAPARLVQLTQILGMQYGAASARRDREVDGALERGLTVMDLVYEVPPAVADAAVTLAQLMDEADEYCAAAHLLTLERPPLLKRFGRWYLEQFVRQCAGDQPLAWDGPLSLDRGDR